MEKESIEDSFEAELVHEIQEPVESQVPDIRRCSRITKPPGWQSEYIMESNVAYCLLTEDGEPLTFKETMISSDVAQWMTIMQEEREAFHKNKTWELVTLP